MKSLGTNLLKLREKRGFPSARAFYLWLEEKGELEFNYAYYKKIENDEKFPSVKVIHSIAACLERSEREALILCFCQNQFPHDVHLFEKKEKEHLHQKEIKKSKSQVKAGTLIGQKELSERQVAVLADCPENFFLFSVMTLARTQVSEPELLQYFRKDELASAITALKKAKLITQENSQLAASYPEYLFPRVQGSQSLKKLYQKLDQYEHQKLSFFGFQKHSKAVFLRRVSPRYIELIQSHIELLYQMVRMADEQNVEQNDAVCSLEVKFHSTHLPG